MAWSAAFYGQLPPTGWMLVTVNVCIPDCPDDMIDELDVPLDEVEEPVEEPVRSPAEPVPAPFSRMPVTRTFWFTYWLRFTLEPCGLSR